MEISGFISYLIIILFNYGIDGIIIIYKNIKFIK
mgnify:CR=1 FL=1